MAGHGTVLLVNADYVKEKYIHVNLLSEEPAVKTVGQFLHEDITTDEPLEVASKMPRKRVIMHHRRGRGEHNYAAYRCCLSIDRRTLIDGDYIIIISVASQFLSSE